MTSSVRSLFSQCITRFQRQRFQWISMTETGETACVKIEMYCLWASMVISLHEPINGITSMHKPCFIRYIEEVWSSLFLWNPFLTITFYFEIINYSRSSDNEQYHGVLVLLTISGCLPPPWVEMRTCWPFLRSCKWGPKSSWVPNKTDDSLHYTRASVSFPEAAQTCVGLGWTLNRIKPCLYQPGRALLQRRTYF